jgi:hypothetical protein
MEVADVEVDLVNYREPNMRTDAFTHVVTDFQVVSRYVSEHLFSVIVKRLDDTRGWDIELSVLIHYLKSNRAEIVKVGKSSINEKELQVHTGEDNIYPSNKPIALLSPYRISPCPPPICISREEFNIKFNTDIAILPKSLYVVGLSNSETYIYNDARNMWYEIMPQWRHILNVALTFTNYRKFYFIVSSNDGYLEEIDTSKRTNPQKMVEGEELKENCYPVWHSKRWIFCNSAPLNIPYTIGMADRHVLHLCELYHHYRSFHRGIPFQTKISKIIYGGRLDRGSSLNFTNRKDISISPRKYFYSAAVPKTNIVCSENEWIKDTEMVKYKYILDIDGHGSTWDGTAWKLNSGSVIFKSDSRWQQWFYDEYKPWIHYIPIKDDFSDIDEQFEWCEAHQDECEKIIKNAKALFQKVYRFHNIVKHTIKLIELAV